MKETLVFLKIVSLAFKSLIPTSFPLVEAFLLLYELHRHLFLKLNFNVLKSFTWNAFLLLKKSHRTRSDGIAVAALAHSCVSL